MTPKDTMDKGQQHALDLKTPAFGDIVENGWASEDNPTRKGMFVRAHHRPSGRVNPGLWWTITDGKGKFWDVKPRGEHRLTVASGPFAKIETLEAERSRPSSEGESGIGWVYFGPDVGIEYAPEHPIDSGETPDATDVRPSTAFEDWLVAEVKGLEAKVRELAVNPALSAPKAVEQGEVVDRLRQGLVARGVDVAGTDDPVSSALVMISHLLAEREGNPLAKPDACLASPFSGVSREQIARKLFAVLHPHESWADFDQRRAARGAYHPMQLQALELADALLNLTANPHEEEARPESPSADAGPFPRSHGDQHSEGEGGQ